HGIVHPYLCFSVVIFQVFIASFQLIYIFFDKHKLTWTFISDLIVNMTDIYMDQKGTEKKKSKKYFKRQVLKIGLKHSKFANYLHLFQNFSGFTELANFSLSKRKLVYLSNLAPK